MKSKNTFWNFLINNNIEIPIIQRDYAQGRLGKENLRKFFLKDLKNALENEQSNDLKLDFIYGTIENGKFNPLDGQQRLTTLWLLHWYIALRAGVLNEENCAILSKFTYETRISSREFCYNLCIPQNFYGFDNKQEISIVDFITRQTWFYSAWKQDPTIQSMLRMLSGTKIVDKKGTDIVDGIEELFSDQYLRDNIAMCSSTNNQFTTYWKKLTDDSCPIIFYTFLLENFGLSDDLYIKMNARGKQLTSFENFKADLVGYIIKQVEDSENKQEEKWELLLDPKEGIPIKIDTDWTDIFWSNKSKGIHDKNGKLYKSNQIDEIYFAFLNRFFWNELFIAKKSENPQLYLLEIGKGYETSTQENENSSYRYLNDSNSSKHNDYDTKIAYQGLGNYKYDNGIPVVFFLKLQKVLNNYYKFSKHWSIPSCSWDDSFEFIPKYVEDNTDNVNNIEILNNANEKILRVSTLNQVQRIAFFAICKYFDHDNTVKDDEVSMKRWMRVVWNLISGRDENDYPQIRSTSAVRTAIEHIDKLDSHNVYNSLINIGYSNSSSDFAHRWNEEVTKAKKIVDEESQDNGVYWENIIIEAENYAFFKGCIRFLFQGENIDEKGNVNVDWENFELKWEHVRQYFLKMPPKDSVMQDKYKNAELLKIMISWFSEDIYNDVLWNHKINNKAATWLYYLSNNKNCKAIHQLLLYGEKNECNIKYEQLQDDYKKVLYKLAYTSLLDFIINKNELYESKIHYFKGHLAIHRDYGRSGIFLNSDKRDELLDKTTGVNIRSNHIINDTILLFGANIDFTYDNKNFKWYCDNKVYLMDNDNYNSYKKKNDKEFFSFNTKSINNCDEFVAELERLIKEVTINTQENIDLVD